MGYISKIFVTVDVVLFKKYADFLHILLIKRKNEPFRDYWALPGGFVDENEALEVAAKRELSEETSISVEEVTQIKAYGKPFRDPRSHMVTVAFYGEVGEEVVGQAADDAKELKWFRIDELPPLAFDHLDIVRDAIDLKTKSKSI
ncbi:NUDIX hydrolase [Myroides marinus]|uniref:NUDIX hydrolase n=1 Tax=Myroides marinus TaxID=703342 RepID=UPI0025764754|nr:NUDIX hydrolase [Myroides marinus]MDM1352147.1 NUDIX hydrolase [Myroides marinus]MDM1359353.1 NUDIX hydrolase [Myroides marinus]MDM1375542.1 NUDIX hydrolase [Myroides marinus]MDM1382025.1 NUDIX hydrolase [Myroides marinus]